MDAAITPTQLRNLRKLLGLTAQQAADSVRVNYRTWKGYEAPYGAASHRDISESTLSHFCIQHELAYPPISDDGRLIYKNCKVLSFAAFKGGVGKSPITIAVAALLANQGHRVAVVTNDIVYRCHIKGERPESVKRLREEIGVDFYDEVEVLLYPYEVKEIEGQLARDKILLDPEIIAKCDPEHMYCSELCRLESKKSAKYIWSDLLPRYDYIFVDFNRMPDETFLLSTLIVIILDGMCTTSINSAKKLRDRFVELNGGNYPEKVFGLMTNFNPSAPSDSAFYVIESEEPDQSRAEEIAQLVRAEDLEIYERYSRIYRIVKETNIPLLNIHLTNSHRVEIERYNADRTFWEGFCYFNTVVNFAPESPPADEIKRLVREIRSLLRDLAT
ncbi:hypothetical protein ACI7YU_18795 [Pseudomonas siliginis]|uniref:nucleotide-binding protein n=1 Tax=Pseudomonas siliginis TaxID=2842346 RepID=UPI00386C4C8B